MLGVTKELEWCYMIQTILIMSRPIERSKFSVTPENFELKFMFAIILPMVGLGIEYETFIPRKPQTNEELIINTKLSLV